MTTLCLYAPLLQCFLTMPVEFGYASQYGPGVMAATVEARQGWGHLPQDLSAYQVFGAVADCGRIGDEFLVTYNGITERGIVSDCAANDGTPQWMEENRIVIETDHETAVRWGIEGRGGIAVSLAWIIEEVPLERCNVPI